MTLDELLDLVRSGAMVLTVQYYAPLEQRRLVRMYKDDSAATRERDPQVVECIEANVERLNWLVGAHDATICSDPVSHAPSHIAATWMNYQYTRCDECARIRAKYKLTDEQLLQIGLVGGDR